MSDSFEDMPKFPKEESDAFRDHFENRPEPEDTFADWVRHAHVNIILATFIIMAAVGSIVWIVGAAGWTPALAFVAITLVVGARAIRIGRWW